MKLSVFSSDASLLKKPSVGDSHCHATLPLPISLATKLKGELIAEPVQQKSECAKLMILSPLLVVSCVGGRTL